MSDSQRRVVTHVAGGVRADDAQQRGPGPAGVVQVRHPVAQPGPQVQQHRGGPAGEARVGVRGAGRDALEQGEHAAHLGDGVQRLHEVHLGGAGVHEAHVHAGLDQRADQRLGAPHASRPGSGAGGEHHDVVMVPTPHGAAPPVPAGRCTRRRIGCITDSRLATWEGTGVARPLLQSKYRIPGHRPGTVARPRLAEALGGALRAAVTVVSAPAGFGKSTLLADWLADLPRRDGRGGVGVAGRARRRPGALLGLRAHRGAGGRPASATTRWGCWSRRRHHRDRARRPAERRRRDASRPCARPRRSPPRRPRRWCTTASPSSSSTAPTAAPPRARDPGRPAAPPGAVARTGRAARGPGRRPALHRAGVRGLPQRADGPGALRGTTSRRSTGVPRAGSPPCSSRRSRCGAATTSGRSSRGSPATTATSSTTWPRRCSRACPRTCGSSCSRRRSSSA